MISVVIPSYNRSKCILHLLGDLRAQQDAEFEVIVVDDCSPDDTVEMIRQEFPEFTLLVNDRNGGPCVSRNRGVLAAKGDIIIGFDSDVSVPDVHLLAKVAKAFGETKEVAGFAFRIYESDGVTDDSPRWWHPLPIESAKTRSFETDYFSGTGYAFRRAPMIHAGLFPEIFYMHYEEVELAWRILDQGGSILYRPDFAVVHHANPVSRRSEIKVFYKPRNQILLAVGCLPTLQVAGFLSLRIPYQFLAACAGGYLPRFIDAMRSAKALIPARLAERRPISRNSIISMRKLRNMQNPGSSS